MAYHNLRQTGCVTLQTCPHAARPGVKSPAFICLAASGSIAMAGLVALMYSSWLGGDDFVLLGLSSLPLKERIVIAGGSYFHWVSRIGESIADIGNISFYRWQIIILTPLLLLSVPFSLWRIVHPRDKVSIFSKDGVLFFWFIMLLLMLPASKGWWQSLIVYAFCLNYIWPTVAILVLLALILKAEEPSRPTGTRVALAKWGGMFTLGIFCGWGSECTTVFLLPFCLAWLLYHCVKRTRLPLHVLAAIKGVTLGAMFLFHSTAHACRAVKAESFRAISPENMSPEQVLDFVQHLTPEKVAMLGGDNVILTGIPLHLHMYFLPFMAKLFFPIALPFMLAVAIMLPCLLLHADRKRIFLFSALGLATAWVIASSYLAKCIPTAASFAPPAFFILAACALAFVHLKTWQKAAMLILAACASCHTFLPSAWEAFQYKKYERASYAAVYAQIAEGKQDVVFPCSYAVKPENPLGLIDTRTISARNTGDIYNKSLATYLGIHSIIRETPPDSMPGKQANRTAEPKQ